MLGKISKNFNNCPAFFFPFPPLAKPLKKWKKKRQKMEGLSICPIKNPPFLKKPNPWGLKKNGQKNPEETLKNFFLGFFFFLGGVFYFIRKKKEKQLLKKTIVPPPLFQKKIFFFFPWIYGKIKKLPLLTVMDQKAHNNPLRFFCF